MQHLKRDIQVWFTPASFIGQLQLLGEHHAVKVLMCEISIYCACPLY